MVVALVVVMLVITLGAESNTMRVSGCHLALRADPLPPCYYIA